MPRAQWKCMVPVSNGARDKAHSWQSCTIQCWWWRLSPKKKKLSWTWQWTVRFREFGILCAHQKLVSVALCGWLQKTWRCVAGWAVGDVARVASAIVGRVMLDAADEGKWRKNWSSSSSSLRTSDFEIATGFSSLKTERYLRRYAA